MSRVAEIINKLPNHVRAKVEAYRRDYNTIIDLHMQAEVRTRMSGYVLGLRDAGMLTEFERRVVFIYMTVAPEEVKVNA